MFNMRLKWVFCFLIIASIELVVGQSLPQNDSNYLNNLNTITSAVPFLTITPDSRAGSMGEVGVATSADIYSLHWNPAKLAFLNKSTIILSDISLVFTFLGLG